MLDLNTSRRDIWMTVLLACAHAFSHILAASAILNIAFSLVRRYLFECGAEFLLERIS